MQLWSLFCTVIFLLFNSLAFAQVTTKTVSDDLPFLKSLLLPGEEIAATYKAGISAQTNEKIVYKRTGAELLGAISTSYLKKDFNRDGNLDLALVVEKAPGTSPRSNSLFGDRKLKVYLGTADQGFELVAENQSVILSGDQGLPGDDPFLGLSLNSKGSLVVEHYGGSARKKWTFKQVFQYRKNQVYLVGESKEAFFPATGMVKLTDSNFLTRVQIISQSGNASRTVVRKKILQKELLQLSQVKVSWESFFK
jgi:hypothetical protein